MNHKSFHKTNDNPDTNHVSKMRIDLPFRKNGAVKRNVNLVGNRISIEPDNFVVQKGMKTEGQTKRNGGNYVHLVAWRVLRGKWQ